MTGARLWLEGARPRTLGASIVPVAVGTAAAGTASVGRTIALVIVALGMQVGVNYANDYADGVRGVDTPARVGPLRLTASGTAPARAVAAAAALSFLAAAIAGGVLALVISPWLFAVGIAAVLAAVTYSAGPKPYASRGLGELSVFVFFGLVAVCGSAYVQAEQITARAWWSAPPVGLLAVAILIANNLRDIPTDAAAGKRTLAVRLGDANTRLAYRVCVLAAYILLIAGAAGPLPLTVSLALATMPLAAPAVIAAGGARGKELVGLLVSTARLHLVFGALLALGLAWR